MTSYSDKRFGLIGKTLKHSFSKPIHNALCDYEYELYELNSDELKSFVDSDIDGFNVTIPYKKEIMPYLDEIDESAKRIGSVNTVVKRDGKKIGYNTDFDGMRYMLNRAGITIKGKVVMILGTGGTGTTALAVCKYCQAKQIIVVSRSGDINYDNCYNYTDVQVIINTTPVGMYPDNFSTPIDITKFLCLEGVADVIYNPALTKFCFTAKEKGIKYTNGLPMLVAQAKYAAEKFINDKISDEAIESVLKKINADTGNIILVGMPGSGKSVIGKRVAQLTGKKFVDVDAEIERKAGSNIPSIFENKGEAFFRECERKVIEELSVSVGSVIATGGGAVKDENNYYPLKQNGVIFWILRDLDILPTEGRPLSKDTERLKQMFIERQPMYNKFADFKVLNDDTVDKAAKEIIDYYENYGY